MNDNHDYLVASRQGIYYVNHSEYRLLRDGYYFGITVSGADIYCFKSRPLVEAAENPRCGSIVRYRYRDGELSDGEVMVEGLDYNGHQVDVFDGAFWLVDSGNQQILEFDANWNQTAHRIGPPVARRSADDAHINAFHGRGDRIYLMFHNGHRGIPSEIVEFDRGFRETGRTRLASTACHDVVPLEDGSLLYCESIKGQLAIVGGERYKIDALYTRGLAVGDAEIAVGSSLYGARASRHMLPGFVTFLDRAYNRVARLHLPAAPTQIRRLDGNDRSLSTPR
ncbi:hypothetical protein P7L78_00425 (plasmid) [Tistrella bauzanensis]|uniref:Uncharacterized protein n=1 Tax=Tistrella arctica TaxID=3133430 RepID=A0ABU9YKX1_9PROT